jgi:hypothetical protein
MVITHVGATRVSTPKEFFAAIDGKTGLVQLRQALPKGQSGASSKLHSIPAGQ